MFIHCYAHKLNLVRRMSSCKRFFSVLTGLSTFFSRSTKRSSALDLHVKHRISTASETRWNSNARFAGSVHSIRRHLVSFFADVSKRPQLWDDAIVDAASGYVAKLHSTELLLLPEVFQTILPTQNFCLTFCKQTDLTSLIVIQRSKI